MNMKTKINLRAGLRPLFATALMVIGTNNAYAVFPNILGTYSGTDNSTASGCTNPADNGTFTDPVTFDIITQSGADFTGTVGGTDPLSLVGTVDGAGNVSGTFSGATESGSFSGTIASGSGSLSYSGFNSADGCTITGNVTVTGGAGTAVFAPSTAPSTALTGQQTLTTSITSFSTAVTQRLTSLRSQNNTGGISKVSNGFMLQNNSGMSAGDATEGPLGVWGSITHTQSEDDFSSTAFDAKRNTLMVGVDMSPREDFVIGLAVGYEDSEIETKFNGGEADSDGFTFIAYGTKMIDDTFSIDVMGGISQIDIDQFRTLPNTATRVSSSTDADRLFFSGNLNASREYDNWFVTGRAGVLWASEGQEGFTESNGRVVGTQEFDIGQFRVGADAAYLTGSEWEPYGSLTLEYDYSREDIAVAAGNAQPSMDRSGATLGLGMRYYGKDGVTGNLEYSTVLGRDNYSEGSLNMTLRAEF